MTKRIAFFDAKPYDRKSFDACNKDFGFEIIYFEPHLAPQTVDLTHGFDAVCAFVNDTLNKEVVEKIHENDIELIALRSAGYNNVDIEASYGKVHVVRVPAYSPYAVAEHAMALILSLNRKIHKAYYRIRDGNFSINGFLGFDMYGKTMGIIGTGKIGQCLAAISKGFGMEVLAYDPYPNEEFAKEIGVRYVALEDLYKESDIISLHCPLTNETDHLIDRDSMAQMKDGVMIINTGRGRLIDTSELINALKEGKVGSAGLDVYEEESEYFFEDRSTAMIADDVLARLLSYPNVLVTSHQGFFTAEALHNIAETTLGNIREFFDGGFLKNEICYRCPNECRKKQGKRCF